MSGFNEMIYGNVVRWRVCESQHNYWYYQPGPGSRRSKSINLRRCDPFTLDLSRIKARKKPQSKMYVVLSSPGPKPVVSNPLVRNQKPRGLGLTLKCCRPPPPPPPTHHHPPTFKHEGGVWQKNSKSKKGSEWSLLPVWQKSQVDSKRKGMG